MRIGLGVGVKVVLDLPFNGAGDRFELGAIETVGLNGGLVDGAVDKLGSAVGLSDGVIVGIIVVGKMLVAQPTPHEVTPTSVSCDDVEPGNDQGSA
eukprot:scaffold5294_cov72-Cyclotella_meneghiniana.AAC.14